MWQVYVFNFVAALLIAGWYVRACRRLEQRMAERMKRFDAWADAEDAKYGAWADAEDAKYDIARDEIKASLRAQVDRAIAKMQAHAPADPRPSANGHTGEPSGDSAPVQPIER